MSRKTRKTVGDSEPVSRFDRYILSQLLNLFGFFALILVSVYWINRAVILFDQLITNGHNVSVFLELTILTLPNVIRLVVPMAVFAATIFVINRLSSESELTVMQATGFSPWRLARPVLIFGMIVAVMMSMLTHYLVPASLLELQKRQNELAENVTAGLLTEGTFLHPSDGVTFYIRDITSDGVLRDVFLSDRRAEGRTVTYTAAEAYLVQDAQGPKLVMLNGLSQQYIANTERLSTTNFADFSYDISAIVDTENTRRFDIRTMWTPELLFNRDHVMELTGRSSGYILAEINGRFAQALITIVFPMIGFAMLLVGGYSRFGVWRQILIAFVILVLLETAKSIVTDPVRKSADLWPLIYLPTALGAAISAGLLKIAASPLRWRKAAS